MAQRNRDAQLRLYPSGDGMSCSADFEPALGTGRPLDAELCAKILEAEGIVHGVDVDLLGECLARCAAGEAVAGALIARGTAPEDADPAYLKLAQKFFTVRLYGRERGGRVDFHEVRPFIIVAADEALARFTAASPGVPGRDIYGVDIEPGVKRRIPFAPGENTYRDGDILRSKIEGRISLEKNKVAVREILELSGVDFRTGNIRFPGDVVLRGEVSDGFSILCGGDMLSEVPLDVTDIQVRGDLTVAGGVLGRRPGILKVGGALEARFLENLELECRGSVTVSGTVLNSRIHTLGKLICGEKGRIIHSRIYAVGGVEALQLGNSAGQLTLISCGSDFRILRRALELRQRRRRLKLKLETLEGLRRGGGLAPPLELRLSELVSRTGEQIRDIEESVRELMSGIESDPEARILAHDTVYPGVSLEICQVTRRITSSVPRGEFYLDPVSREIAMREAPTKAGGEQKPSSV